MSSESGIAVDGAPPAARTTRRSPLYPPPQGLVATLRVVMVVSRHMPAWLLRLFDLAADNDWLDLVVLPIDGEPPAAAPALPADLRALLRHERGRTAEVAMARVVVASHDGVAFATAVHSGLDTAALRAQVGLLQPDLVLLVGASRWAEALGDQAPWGCWNFDDSLTDAGRAAQALLGPVMRGDVATAIELQLHHLDRSATTLETNWGSTCRSSASGQREAAFKRIPALLMRSLRRLASGDLQVPRHRAATLRLASDTTPGAGDGLRTLANTLGFRFAARVRQRSRPCEGAWHVLLRHAPEPMDPAAPEVPRHTPLLPAAQQFWADPFVMQDEGRNLLFVEQWERADAKGVIVCVELFADARCRPLGIALEQPFHLSYPQVFQWQGQWYMSVESGQAGCVSLYTTTTFPLHWEHVTDLLVGRTCVDPTLHHLDGIWYLFTNVAEGGGSTCDELFLFVADDLLGPFRPHPANPIVSDARRARPAGRLFVREGRLIRPAQDCAPSYGAAVVFNEVLELTPTHYRERRLGRLGAGWASGLDGCHTYNAAGGIEVLDARGTPSARSAHLKVKGVPLLNAGVPTSR